MPLSGLDLVVLATGMVPNAVAMPADGGEDVELPERDINPLSEIPVAGYSNGAPAKSQRPAARHL